MVRTKTTENRTSVLHNPRKQRKAKGMPLTKRQLQQVKSAIQSDNEKHLETKYFEYANQLSNGTASTPVIFSLSAMSQGDGSNERVGNEVTPKYLTFRSKLTGAASGSGDNQGYRLMLIQWLEDVSDNAIAIGDVLESSSFVFSNYKHGQSLSFKVLYDEMGTVAKNSANPDHTQFIKFTADLKKAGNIQFDGTTATHNQLYLIFWSDEVTNAPAFRWGTRLAYTDA